LVPNKNKLIIIGEKNMNETIKTLLNRRSIRKFKPDQITDEELLLSFFLCKSNEIFNNPSPIV